MKIILPPVPAHSPCSVISKATLRCQETQPSNRLCNPKTKRLFIKQNREEQNTKKKKKKMQILI